MKAPTKKPKPQDALACSFCGKSRKDVKKLIAGATECICDECVALCNEIIAEEDPNERARKEALELLRSVRLRAAALHGSATFIERWADQVALELEKFAGFPAPTFADGGGI